MLVVTANWGFADGTLVAPAFRRGHVRGWRRAVLRAAARAGFRRDGSYRPIDGLQVVLAGDTLDGLVSAEWTGRLRPWDGGAAAAVARQRVMRAAARQAAPLLAVLAGWTRGRMLVPAADSRGRPRSDTRATVSVRVTLLAGDRDAGLEEPPRAVGGTGLHAGRIWSDGAVLVAHGEAFDPLCHVEDADGADRDRQGRPPTLAESVAVDLVARFGAAVRNIRGADAVRDRLLPAIAGAGPLGIPAALASWRSTPQAVGTPHDVLDAWRRSVEAWSRSADRMPPTCLAAADPCPALAAWYDAAALATAGDIPGTDALQELLLPIVPNRGAWPAAASPRASPGIVAAVLGHPSTTRQPAGGDAEVICLGQPPVRRWRPVSVVRRGTAATAACVTANPVSQWPTSVVLRRDAAGLAWHDLGPGRTEANAVVAPASDRVVDAA